MNEPLSPASRRQFESAVQPVSGGPVGSGSGLSRMEQVESGPTLAGYLRSIMARKWTVLLTALLITALGLLTILAMTPIYRANAVLNVQNPDGKVVNFESLVTTGQADVEFLQTQNEFIRSRDVRNRVIQLLDLTNEPSFNPRIATESKLVTWLRGVDAIAPYLPEPPKPPQLTDQEAAAWVNRVLGDNLGVSIVRKSNLIEVTYENPDPVLASRVANAFSEEYIKADLDARFNEQQKASEWLNTRLTELRDTLEGSEKTLQDFREQLGLVGTPGASMGGTVRTLDSAGQNLLQTRMEAARLQQVYRQVRRQGAARYEVPEVFNNAAVASARNAESLARKNYVQLQQELGGAHPQLLAAKAEFEAATQNKIAQAEAVIQTITREYQVARNTVAVLEKTLESSKQDVSEVNRKEGQLTVLERELATNQQVYDAFLTKVKETDATSDFRTPVARVIDPAVPPSDPAKPAKAQLGLLSLIGGLVAGCALAIGLEMANRTIRNSDEVESLLGVPLVAAAPILKDRSTAEAQRVVAEEGGSHFAESIRTAVASTKLASLSQSSGMVISVTSSVPGEGKTTVACNFAIEMARSAKTILVEADLRKPTFISRFKLPAGRPGFAEALAGEKLENCSQFLSEFNLTVLPASRPNPKALSLLMSGGLPKVIEALQENFDVIVFDNPPLELVADGLAVCQHSTGVLMVVKSSETPVPMAKRNIDRLKNAGINVFGVLLNQHNFKRAGRYYGEYTGQGMYDSAYYYG